nr:ubiquitin-conjugating enzyme E2 S [Cryptococcus depauperatus CBS 7841]
MSSLSHQALRSLSRQVIALKSDPPEGVRIVVDEEDLSSMEGWIQGPPGTPYEGGYFRIKFAFGPDFPNLPPKCNIGTMMTKIFHPNISKTGEICVDTLKKGWKKEFGVGHVLVTIKCLLIYPNPESALDEEAGKQLLEDYEGYSKHARLMTGIHATPKTLPSEFSSSSSSTKLSSNIHITTTSLKSNSSAASTIIVSSNNTKPSPLGANTSQEQSPIKASCSAFSGNGVRVGGDVKKTIIKATGGVGGVKVGNGAGAGGVTKVKRGAKRL